MYTQHVSHSVTPTPLNNDSHVTSSVSHDQQDEEGDRNPGSNLFVTGISPSLNVDAVRRMFERYGDVKKCSIVCDPHTNDSRGFGFVDMETPEMAEAAKEGLQGQVTEGRTLSIEKARRSGPRKSTPGKYFGPPKKGTWRRS